MRKLITDESDEKEDQRAIERTLSKAAHSDDDY